MNRDEYYYNQGYEDAKSDPPVKQGRYPYHHEGYEPYAQGFGEAATNKPHRYSGQGELF